MNKKNDMRAANVNLALLLITIFASITFINSLKNALPQGSILNSVELSLFQCKLAITEPTGSQHNSIVGYYPLISIFGGILFNSYLKIRNYVSFKASN